MAFDLSAPPTTRPNPLPALTGLRLIGAAWVVAFHFQPTLYEAWPQLRLFEPIFSHGDFGVPLFFVLSGFIIWHNYGSLSLLNVRTTAKFLWRRCARLWPVNLASAVLVIPVVWWGVINQNNFGAPKPEWYSKIGWLKSAFMVQEIGRADLVFAWNQPSWSLTAEMVAYVVFPIVVVVVFATGVVRSRHKWVWAALALLIAYLVENKEWLFPSRWLVELFLMFAAGVLLRIASDSAKQMAVFASIVQIAAPLAIVVVCYVHRAEFLVVLLGAWVWSLAGSTGPGVWFFSLRWLQTAGLSSYSLYMLHWVLFGYGYIFLHYLPVVRSSFLQLFVIAMLLLVAAAAWATWRFFETPARKVLNRVFDRLWPVKQPSSAIGAGSNYADASGDQIS